MATFNSAAMAMPMMMMMIMQLGCSCSCARAELSPDFYSATCPDLASLVDTWFQLTFPTTLEWAPAVLRLFFHDCMVQGCDASILLTQNLNGSEPVEREAPENFGLDGFDIINDLKVFVEEQCPQVVSCADILALSAQIAVVATLGPSWPVDFGRRDGFTSLATSVKNHIPSESSDVDQLMEIFSPLGLSKEDLVVLSGAHTIGVSHCNRFLDRIYNFSSDTNVDPSMNLDFARQLQQQCSHEDVIDVVPLDVLTNSTFDNSYYNLVLKGQGLLSSDEALAQDVSTIGLVSTLASSQEIFFDSFVASMIKLSKVGVLEGLEGEVRKQCDLVNT